MIRLGHLVLSMSVCALLACCNKREPRSSESSRNGGTAAATAVAASPAQRTVTPIDVHEPAEATCSAARAPTSSFDDCQGLTAGERRFFPSSSGPEATLPAELTRGDPDEFTLVALPDTQYYAEKHPEILLEQARFVLRNRELLQIGAVVELGDLVDRGDSVEQWQRAAAALSLLERAGPRQPHGVPYGIAVGNHDQQPRSRPEGTAFYNRWFGRERFRGREYYGGHHAEDNDNSFFTFARGAHRYVVLLLEYDENMDADVVEWARDVLQSRPDHTGIVVSHYLIDGRGEWGEQGLRIYRGLQSAGNLALMLGGHMVTEARRSDPRSGGVVHTLLSNYQTRARGGEGWLRLVRFFPNRREIGIFTYSPLLSRWEVDRNSRFDLVY